MRARDLVLAGLLTTGASVAAAAAQTPRERDEDPMRVLVFSKTAGFRHASIEDGVRALKAMAERERFELEHTEDAAAFRDENLERFDVVLFLSTTGDVLDDAQERAFEAFIRGGGGYVGVHAAADTEYDWPWYGELVGGYFKSHPAIQKARLHVVDRRHPATRHLPEVWTRTDEWYNYRENPRGDVHVLMTLDETSYEGGEMGADHPIAWCREYDGGRAFYTGGGHTKESFGEPEFLRHVLGGMRWAAGEEDAEIGATIDSHWEKVILDDRVTDPMELAVAPDGRVIFVERAGVIKMWEPGTRMTSTIGFVEVFDELEDGLLGVTLDPTFEETGWLYVYYSPAETIEGDVPTGVQRVSRLTLKDGWIEPGTEVTLLEIPTQRQECCHSGGSLAFGPDGCLYISTGDNTNPFASDGFAPIDERPGRMPWDAQKSSSNTQDLRGKILRIRPLPDGTYEVPAGNLFGDPEDGRPEIYAMGCRNPFRIAIDPRSGTLYWGDVGPDAPQPLDDRGPAGHDEWNRTDVPGFFGWPYFTGRNRAYHDHDFATGESGEVFDVDGATNDSPNNTGARTLPPAKPTWIAYTYRGSEAHPMIGAGGRCAMAGPVYHFEESNDSTTKLPAYFDGAVFIYEWAQNWIKAVHADEAGEILGFTPVMAGTEFIRPMDLELGPDGCLYLIEWGTGFGGGNADARLSRLEFYRGGLRPPVAVAKAVPDSGPAPLIARLEAHGSKSRNPGATIECAWDFDLDGVTDATGAEVVHAFEEAGNTVARLTVTDSRGQRSVRHVPLAVGNTEPEVFFAWPLDGSFAGFGETVPFRVTVKDEEDGSVPGAIAPEKVRVQPMLGHDTHAHPLSRTPGPAGKIEILRDAGHGTNSDLFTVLTATYTDRGAEGVAPITGSHTVVLQPRRKRAEHHAEGVNVIEQPMQDGEEIGGSVVFDAPGDAIAFEPVNLINVEAFDVRLAGFLPEGRLALRVGSPDGPTVGEAAVPAPDPVHLEPGLHPLRLEYFERSGECSLTLSIEGPGIGKRVVPATMLRRSTGSTEPGLRVTYFEPGDATSLPDFSTLRKVGEGVVETVDFAPTSGEFATSGRADEVAAVLEGYLAIDTPGEYTLHVSSDDGSRLWIDGEVVVENDGIHATRERSQAERWRTIRVPVVNPGGTHALWLVREGGEAGSLEVSWLEAVGAGATARPGETSSDK